MAETDTYQMLVIGGGPAGYVAAVRGARLGLRTALVDKRETLGGTCLNVGCIPSKALLDSSEQFHRALHGLEVHGVRVEGVSLDLATMMKRKDSVVEKLTGGVAMLCKQAGVHVFTGEAELTGAHSVLLRPSGQELSAENIVVASGSVPVTLPKIPYDGERVVSSTEALAFDTIPQQLVVIGAGAIGLEMASVWARLGSEVTVVELQSGILPGWDVRAAKVLQQEMEKLGVEFMLGAQVLSCSSGARNKSTLQVQLKDGTEAQLEADKVLVAVGRKPWSEGLGLEAVGVQTEKGRVLVNERFESSVPGIFAVGDVVHGPMLAHKAEDDGFAVAEIIAGKPGMVDYNTVPNVVYTWPELASVGRTEAQLREAGVPFRKGQASFGANGRALAMEESSGFVKLLAHADTDRILGAQIVGPWASDLIAEIVAVMEFGGSAEDLARTCHAHPTLSEVVREAALTAAGMPLHGA